MVTCEEFDLDLAELALGHVDGERRAALLEHATGCVRCSTALSNTVDAVDDLLLLAPEAEPPAGFENRVLARTVDASAVHSPPRRWRSLAVAGAVMAVAAGLGTGWLLRGAPSSGDPSASIIAASGVAVGEVRLVGAPTPAVVVTVDAPNAQPGRRTCELQRPDGSWVAVGTWTLDDVADGFWAASIDPALLDSTAMRVVTDDRTVLATADFG